MASDIQPDMTAIPSGSPGAQGPAGNAGSNGAAGAAGANAYTTTTAEYVQPAVNSTVNVSVASSAWMAVGGHVFIQTGGYYTIHTISSATLVVLTNRGESQNALPGATVPSGSRIMPAGPTINFGPTIAALGDRITTLEDTAIVSGEEGAQTFFSATEPDGLGEKEGDIWFDSNDGNHIYRYNGTVWVDAIPTIDLGDATGTIDGTQIDDDSITTPKLVANSVTAAKVATSSLITLSAQIDNGIINDAHIADLTAAKITAGNIGAINIGMAGRIYNPTYPAVFFRPITLASNGGQNGYVSGTGTGFAFTLPTALEMVGPGHADAGSKPIVNPDSGGVIRVQYFASIIGDSPDVDAICVFYRKNDTGPYIAMDSRSSNDAANQRASGIRGDGFFSSIAATDSLKFYCAPCDAAGDIASSVTSRVELDIIAFNW